MNFCWCTMNVMDTNVSIKFYQELVGLTVTSRFSPRPGMEIVFLKDEKGNEIELIKPLAPSPAWDREGISIGFEVSSLDDALALAGLKGIPIAEGPFVTPSVKFFFVRDPDGFKVQIVEKTGK